MHHQMYQNTICNTCYSLVLGSNIKYVVGCGRIHELEHVEDVEDIAKPERFCNEHLIRCKLGWQHLNYPLKHVTHTLFSVF